MDNEINDWSEECSNQPISIWCEDPETHTEKIAGGVLERSYVTYRILMKQVGRDIIGVRHRYSEFETLRNSLKDQYSAIGIAIPSLPPKTIIVAPNLMESFIKERTLGLTIFCEMVADSPWLRNDENWKAFMRPNTANTTGLGGANETAITSTEFCAKNIGEVKLISCLMKLEVPYKLSLLQRMADLKQELQITEKNAKTLLDKARALQSCERAYCSAQESLVDSYKQWLQSERTNIKTLSGRIFDENDNVLHIQQELPSHSANSLSNLATSQYLTFEPRPQYTGLSIVVMFEQEISLIESLKELLKLHDEMVASIESMKNKIHKVENSRATNRFEVANEHRKTLEDKQSCLAAFYKGFSYFTLPYCVRQRAASLRKQTAMYVSSIYTISYTMQVACLKYFEDMSMNPSSVIIDTCKVLDLLKVKKLDQTPNDNNLISTISLTELSGLSLSSKSSGMKGLYERSVCISFPEQTKYHTTTTETAYASLSPTRQLENNPLTRKHSSNSKLTTTNAINSSSNITLTSLMTEISDDEFQSHCQIQPPPNPPPPIPSYVPEDNNTNNNRAISPIRLTEKSQHLIAELTNNQDNTAIKGIWD